MSQITEDILSKIDIVDIISKYIPLKRSGSNFAGLSPFKQEKTPSFMVSPRKQIFKDFSTGIGGNAITFIIEVEKVDFWDAVKILAKEANIDLREYELNPQKMEEFSDEREKIKRIHKITQQYFVQELAKNEEAISYLKTNRNLNDDIIDQFGIGFAPDSNYGLVQFLKSKGFADDDILQSSLAKKGQNTDSYSFFRNRITFPIYDTMSNIIGFGARVLNPKDTPKYINSGDHKAYDKSKILYGLNIAKQNLNLYNKLIVVEGYMDVIALARFGFKIGVATCGTSLTEDHMKILKRYTENVFFLFDNDEAGEMATFRALKIAYQQNIFPKIIELSSNVKDIDELANQEHGQELFDNILKKSKDGFLTYFQTLRDKKDMNSPIEKQKVMSKMFELILAVDNYAIQDHYIHVLSDNLGFAYEILNAQFKKFKKTEGSFELKQKLKKNENEIYKLDREIIFASLFYQNFVYKYIQDDEKWKGFLLLSKQVGELYTGSILDKILRGDLNEKEIREVDEMHIRWETQLDDILDEGKKYSLIKKIVGTTLQSYLQIALKDSKISNEQKSSLLELRKLF
ncbi:MAG: DNA primase [Candidatus Absconditicoccaceae bacterium]